VAGPDIQELTERVRRLEDKVGSLRRFL